jgi:nucleoid-associated protein YgaU
VAPVRDESAATAVVRGSIGGGDGATMADCRREAIGLCGHDVGTRTMPIACDLSRLRLAPRLGAVAAVCLGATVGAAVVSRAAADPGAPPPSGAVGNDPSTADGLASWFERADREYDTIVTRTLSVPTAKGLAAETAPAPPLPTAPPPGPSGDGATAPATTPPEPPRPSPPATATVDTAAAPVPTPPPAPAPVVTAVPPPVPPPTPATPPAIAAVEAPPPRSGAVAEAAAAAGTAEPDRPRAASAATMAETSRASSGGTSPTATSPTATSPTATSPTAAAGGSPSTRRALQRTTAARILRARARCRNAGRRVAPPAIYVVTTGDTLWAIAERHYHSGRHYRRIVRANRRLIVDPDLIYPCQRFRLPA